MTDLEQPKGRPQRDCQKPNGLLTRLMTQPVDRPATFALGVISISALLFLFGTVVFGVVSGEIDLLGFFMTAGENRP